MHAYREKFNAYRERMAASRAAPVVGGMGLPLITLLAEFTCEHPEKESVWLLFISDAAALEAAALAIASRYPHLADLTHWRNPSGVSIFFVTPFCQLWLIEEPYEEFWRDFTYPPERCCLLNVPLPAPTPPPTSKPWLVPPPEAAAPREVIIVGAGLAGVMTAYFLAVRGVKVTLLEAAPAIATKASGNYQGMLYAKVSAFATAQSRLLYRAYPVSLSFLKSIDTEGEFSALCGILHLDFSEREKRRNEALARKEHGLFYGVKGEETAQIAGTRVGSGGLFWRHGGWVSPARLLAKLASHPNITVKTNFAVKKITHDDGDWQVTNEREETISAPALVLALGADEESLYSRLGLHFTHIGGQTSVVNATEASLKLKTVLNGTGYIAPAFHGKHCFGASFSFKNLTSACTPVEEQKNVQHVQETAPELYAGFLKTGHLTHLEGHHAVRVDSFDHLPAAGPMGKYAWMQKEYAALRLDKNYRLTTPCVYWPGLYINTAHGSKGLLTAPIAAAAITAELLNLPNPLGCGLSAALAPNRLIVHRLVKHKD